jgi:hypothetical protein
MSVALSCQGRPIGLQVTARTFAMPRNRSRFLPETKLSKDDRIPNDRDDRGISNVLLLAF